MPEMDGKEATRLIRQAEAITGRHTPVIAVTAHALPGDGQEILAAGLDEYLTKPLRKAVLIERISASCPKGCLPPVPEGKEADAAPEPRLGFLSRRARTAAA